VQRFSDMMEEMCYIVATKHSGSLKGEHGTGRNVAPFVEMEWGSKVRGGRWGREGGRGKEGRTRDSFVLDA
jgi:D-lactate dehydrogenase